MDSARKMIEAVASGSDPRRVVEFTFHPIGTKASRKRVRDFLGRAINLDEVVDLFDRVKLANGREAVVVGMYEDDSGETVYKVKDDMNMRFEVEKEEILYPLGSMWKNLARRVMDVLL